MQTTHRRANTHTVEEMRGSNETGCAMTIPVWFSDGLILPVRHKRLYVETIIRLILMSGLLSLAEQVHKFTGLLCNTPYEKKTFERGKRLQKRKALTSNGH